MIRKPIQFSPELHGKLLKDVRRYNKEKLEDVVSFHRDRSFAFERLQRKIRLDESPGSVKFTREKK